jgi:hypothetical protein
MLVVAVGAALIALWLDVRVRRPQPRRAISTLVNVAAAFVVLSTISVPIVLIVGGSDSPARKMVALFLFVLPAFVYAFLSVVWFFKLAQTMMRLR